MDVYALGVTMCVLYTRAEPYSSAQRKNPRALARAVRGGERPSWPEHVPPAYRCVCVSMLARVCSSVRMAVCIDRVWA